MNSNNQLNDLDKLAKLLDTQFKIGPIKFGLDSIIGLIPVLGDSATLTMSFYILIRAFFMKAPLIVLLRMFINIIIETLFSIIPFFGNIFDLFWKSNTKNIKLLNKYLDKPSNTIKRSKISILVFIITLILVLTITIGTFVWLAFSVLSFVMTNLG